jgi:hypothetical protein
MKLKVNSQSISAKFKAIEERAEEVALDKIQKIGVDAVNLSPVDTGAFVESWTILPKGSGGGRSRSANTKARKAMSGKLSAGHKEAIRAKSRATLAEDVQSSREAILSGGGAVVRNRAPHQPYVKPTTEGEGPGSGRGDVNSGKRLLATVKDRNM